MEFAIGRAPLRPPTRTPRFGQQEKRPSLQKIEALFAQLKNVNPFYAKQRVKHYVTRATPFEIYNGTKPGQIQLIIPLKSKNSLLYFAYRRIVTFRGTFSEWVVYLKDLVLDSRAFTSDRIKASPYMVNEFNADIPQIAEQLFYTNQTHRWLFKKAVGRYLYKKTMARSIGANRDLITMEPIETQDQVHVLCLATRTIYTYSGLTLLKSVLSNLECQIEAIAEPRQPVNPYTNIPFTYSQMLELYYKLVVWCAQNRRAVPAILTLYRESNFNPATLISVHHNYVQYKAGKNYFVRHDDSDDEFFLDTLEDLLVAYKPLMTRHEKQVLTRAKFTKWCILEPKHHLVHLWKEFVSDYWYYKQTEHFVRESWTSEHTLMLDVKVLSQASRSSLLAVDSEFDKKYPPRPPIQEELDTDEEEETRTTLENIIFIIQAEVNIV
uniref:Uncharacterized protein n=1 Tax=viral metagenome TaxID=1070528 RepID=A0A6C0L0E7_9ZZZZ